MQSQSKNQREKILEINTHIEISHGEDPQTKREYAKIFPYCWNNGQGDTVGSSTKQK